MNAETEKRSTEDLSKEIEHLDNVRQHLDLIRQSNGNFSDWVNLKWAVSNAGLGSIVSLMQDGITAKIETLANQLHELYKTPEL